MTISVEQARKIIDLHALIKSLRERLAVVDSLRTTGCKIEVKINVKDSRGYESAALTVVEGNIYDQKINDTAAIVLGRYSDGLGSKLRKAERELIELGGQP